MVKTLGFQCKRQEVQSLVGKIRSIMQHGMAKKKKVAVYSLGVD